ncbi:MAG: hypothetical protein AAF564_14415 [Bacteroidota bacterium]
MRFKYWTMLFLLFAIPAQGQSVDHSNGHQRLDFARSYFEVGGKGYPAFTSVQLAGVATTRRSISSSAQPYLTWGGFHFWGHAEFYVVFPLQQLLGASNDRFEHAVVTGLRLLPWAIKAKRVRPYVGTSWSAQTLRQGSEAPTHYKDFSLVTDAGLLYGTGKFLVRLGLNFFHDNTWQYPVSTTIFETIETPRMAMQLGVLYAFDSTKNEDPEEVETWNSYPPVARLGLHATRQGDFFVGVGPSSSFSLQTSRYTQDAFPFLDDQVSSSAYLDVALGYQSNQGDWFAALSFRNPQFENKGFGAKQTVQKYALALEFNKFLVDYTGFAPYLGINVSYDHLTYKEERDSESRSFAYQMLSPGLTFGWDIVPGKTSEHLILRTNLRWYPFTGFDVDGRSFDFSQLEYNLIQAVFYPGRRKAKRKR